jgi:hypothetical protein
VKSLGKILSLIFAHVGFCGRCITGVPSQASRSGMKWSNRVELIWVASFTKREVKVQHGLDR